MLDINFIRQNPEKVKKGIAAKQADPKIVQEVLKLDQERNNLLQKTESLRKQRNDLVHSIHGKPDQKIIDKGKKIKEGLVKQEAVFKNLDGNFHQAILQLPNLPLSDVKEGKDESENEVVESSGKPIKFNFKTKDHLELGKILDIIDIERATKVSGSRFYYLKNEGVLLEFALTQYVFNFLTNEGFIPILPPALMRVDTFHKLGYSEQAGNEGYYLVFDPKKEDPKEEANYYLIGTAEHSMVPYYMNEVIEGKDLPKRFVGFSPAFRREAGSYGKDTKGIFRVHQFDKAEMVSFTKPKDSEKEFEYLLGLEKKLFESLKIPYRVVKMCSGDLGFPAAKKYDLEAWMPGQNRYREVTSISTTTDFQARRLNMKFRENGKKDYVHILNGTAFAISRTLIAILENYQQEDGSVKIPEALQKYVGKEIIRQKT